MATKYIVETSKIIGGYWSVTCEVEVDGSAPLLIRRAEVFTTEYKALRDGASFTLNLVEAVSKQYTTMELLELARESYETLYQNSRD